jgi:hypothetical protein
MKWEGVLGARIHAGTIRREAAGVGDTVTVDPEKGYFAITDSSDRNPVFGRRFAQHFSAFIAGFTRGASRVVHTHEEIPSLIGSIVIESEAMLRSLPFHGTCAFTALCFIMTDQGLGALLLHTGDTLLFMSSPERTMSLITKKNFWFVGKSSAFFQIEYVPVTPGTRFLFATDGFYGLLPFTATELIPMTERTLRESPIEDVPDAVFDLSRALPSGADDIALMSLDPAGLDRAAGCGPALLGGTTAYQERKRRGREKEMSDRYEPWDREESEHAIL